MHTNVQLKYETKNTAQCWHQVTIPIVTGSLLNRL